MKVYEFGIKRTIKSVIGLKTTSITEEMIVARFPIYNKDLAVKTAFRILRHANENRDEGDEVIPFARIIDY